MRSWPVGRTVTATAPSQITESGRPHPRRTARSAGGSHGLRRPAQPMLLWVAFILRVVTIEAQGVWRDEVDQWRFASETWRALLSNFLRPGWNGPLYSPLLRGWMRVAGESVFALRFLSALWGMLVVSMTVVLARRLGGRRVAMGAGLLAALSPYMVWYAQEIKMYTWVPMLILLALVALDRACERPRAGVWLVVFIATSLAIYSHILAALVIPVLALWFLLHPRRHARAWSGGVVVLGALTLPYVPLLAWQWPLLWQQRETGYPDFTLGEMASALLNGWSAGISQGTWGRPGVLLAISIGGALLGLVGLLGVIHLRRWRRAGQLLIWLALPLLAVWAVSQRGPIFTDRYLIWCLPGFHLLVAAGVVTLRRLSRPLAGAALVAVMVVGLHGWIAQGTTPIKPEFSAVVEAVEPRRQDGDLLVFQIPYNHHVYAFYTAGELGSWAEAPFSNWRGPDGTYTVGADTVGRQMRSVVAGYDRIWLIYSEAALWDERELVKGWLDDNYRLSESLAFHGVSLYLYLRPPRS